MMFDPTMDADLHIGTEDRKAYQVIKAADIAFVALMQKQIKKGRERVVFGVKVDASPCTTHRIQAEPVFSGCGSPAGDCAEMGEVIVATIGDVRYV